MVVLAILESAHAPHFAFNKATNCVLKPTDFGSKICKKSIEIDVRSEFNFGSLARPIFSTILGSKIHS